MIDDDKYPKDLEFYKLCVWDLDGVQPADVMTFGRMTLKLAEHIYSNWLGTFGRDSVKKNGRLTEMSPWNRDDLLTGTNWSLPICEAFTVEKGGVATRTPEEYRAHLSAQNRNARANMSPSRKAAWDSRCTALRREIRRPVKKLEAQNKSDEEIQAFIARKQALVDRENPKPPKKVKRRECLTDTEDEPESDDDNNKDAAPVRKRKRVTVDGAGPAKKARKITG